MQRILRNVISLFALTLFSHTMHSAASSESENLALAWQNAVTKSGITPHKISEAIPLDFKNNTNVPVELMFNTVNRAIKKRIVQPGKRCNLADSANNLLSLISITVTQGVVPGGNGLYGLQTFNLQATLEQLTQKSKASCGQPITLMLERVPGYLGIPSLTFKLSASQPLASSSSSMQTCENSFEQIIIEQTASPRALSALTESQFIFNNNSYFSMALIYEQNDTIHRIVVGPGKKALLGKDIAAGINIATISALGGTSSPLPAIAHYYKSLDLNLLNIMPKDLTANTFQINVPAYSWDISVETLDTVPTDAILASAYEQTLVSEAVASTSTTNYDTAAEIKAAEIGRQLYSAILDQDQSKIESLKNEMACMYEGEAETGLIKALTLYFYFIARKQGHVFEEGTFVIYDPSAKIYPFIEGLSKTYKRRASHFNALASDNLPNPKPWLAALTPDHRGHDVEIPAMSKKTVLFNKLSQDNTSFYFKPETYGTKHLTTLMGHAGSFIIAQGRKQLPSIFGSDDQPAYSKERIPKEILRNYLAAIEQLPEENADKATFATTAVALGIQSMYHHTTELLKKYPTNQLLLEFTQTLENKQADGNPKYSYLDHRFGHEVILTPQEFQLFSSPIEKNETF